MSIHLRCDCLLFEWKLLFGQYLCIYYTQQFLRILFDLNGPLRKHCAGCPTEEELPINEYGK